LLEFKLIKRFLLPLKLGTAKIGIIIYQASRRERKCRRRCKVEGLRVKGRRNKILWDNLENKGWWCLG